MLVMSAVTSHASLMATKSTDTTSHTHSLSHTLHHIKAFLFSSSLSLCSPSPERTAKSIAFRHQSNQNTENFHVTHGKTTTTRARSPLQKQHSIHTYTHTHTHMLSILHPSSFSLHFRTLLSFCHFLSFPTAEKNRPNRALKRSRRNPRCC